MERSMDPKVVWKVAFEEFEGIPNVIYLLVAKQI